MKKHLVALTFLAAVAQNPALAATFDVTPANSPFATAQSLSGGQTGTIESGGSMSISGKTVAITVTGNATVNNSGMLAQTGTGRAIRDNTGGLTLSVTNNAGATIQTADADVIQMAQPNSSVTFNNFGTLSSLNASIGGSQAIDFNAIGAANSNALTNHAGGLVQASDADSVRPGVNGIVNNAGTIVCANRADDLGDSSDGIDAQNNSGVQITNAPISGDIATPALRIEGARHGITGGAASDTSAFSMSISNSVGGTIQGDNGSGVNIDGFNNLEVVTITNDGTITGKGVMVKAPATSADGDGVDVDGLVTLINTGTIKSLHAYNDTSEGVTVGGGSITNSGTIEGDNSATNADGSVNSGTGRGITLAGLDKDANDNPISPPQGIYANTSVINSGKVIGQSDAGIAVTGQDSGFTIHITNQAGGLIEGGGTVAAVSTGLNNQVSVINSGTIKADTSGKAIDFGRGTGNSLQILGGTAAIIGDISGGSSGMTTLTINPGIGNSFSYGGALSNFASAEIDSGTVALSGINTYTGSTTVAGGILQLDGNLASAIIVSASGQLHGTGNAGAATEVRGGVQPGDVDGDIATLHLAALTLDESSVANFDLGTATGSNDVIQSSGAVLIQSGATLAIHLPATPAPGTYMLMDAGAITGTFSAPTFSPALPPALTASVVYTASRVTLQLQAVSGIALASSANPSVFGQSLSFTATVSGDAPTGTVTFSDGASTLGSVDLSNGVATYSIGSLDLGSHAIHANYTGDDNNASSSATLAAPQQVNQAASATGVSAAVSATLGQSIGVTISVTAVLPGAGAPSGAVTIADGGSAPGDRCTVNLPANQCVLTPSNAGNLTVSATYSGDTDFMASSGMASVAISTVPSVLTVTSSPNPSTVDAPVTLTASVMQTSLPTAVARTLQASAVPSGTVTFLDNGTELAVVPLSAVGNASFTTSTLGTGNHTITVNYSGDAVTAVASFSLMQIVNPAVATPEAVAAPFLSTWLASLLGALLVAAAFVSLRRL